jgi:hypothetical protein
VKYGDERNDILTAIKEKQEYTCFSDYAYQLEPYIETFGMDRIYVLTFEKLISDPVGELRKLFVWLGVDADTVVNNAGSKHNALPESFKKVKGSGMLYDFRNSFIWNAIAPFIPRMITSAAAKLTVEETSKSTDNNEEVTSYLKSLFEEKVKKLEKMLGREFNEWKN